MAMYKDSHGKIIQRNKANRTTVRARRPAKAVAGRADRRRRKSSGDTPYHHGDLHEALLKAAERVLERDGLPG